MLRKFCVSMATSAFVWGSASLGAAAVTQVEFWHSMGGALGEPLQALVEKFNKLNTDYEIVLSYKGSYDEAFSLGVSAYRTGGAPTLMQIYDVGTANMMVSNSYIPVEELFKTNGIEFNPESYIPVIRSYYSDSKTGQLASLPFYSSVPLLYYNKEMFVKAGLDPNKPPKTWQELEEYGKKLQQSGVQCVYSATWFTWPHIENFSSWNGLAIADKGNGMDGLDAKLTMDNPGLIKHLNMLKRFQKDGLFTYYGRAADAQPAFYTGKCAMATLSSSNLSIVNKYAKFDYAVGVMPYDADLPGGPQNPLIGGGSVWVFKNQSPEKYKGAALFLSFMSSPENAAYWHQHTGYMPSVLGAYKLSKEQGYYETHPNYEVAIKELLNKPPLPQTRGIRLGYLPQIRTIMEEEVESAFQGKQTIEQAVKRIDKRGNVLLRRFEAIYK